MSPGRPKLPPDQKRVIRKGIAFSKAEYDQLCRLAFCLRVSSVNELIRLMVLPETVNVLTYTKHRERPFNVSSVP